MRDNNCSEDCISVLAKGKRILFITTKNVDYIRNFQEIDSLKKIAQIVKIIGYKDKSYIIRLLKIYIRLLTMSLKTYNLIFVGFAPQLILPFLGFRFKGKFIVEYFRY